MSPRTSQERQRAAAPAEPGANKSNAEAFAPPADDSDGPAPLALYLAGTAGFAATAIYAGLKFGAPGVVLVLVAASLIGVIAAFWSSLRALIGETKLTGADAFALGAPRAEEEQKRAVLRALKDLEFERSVGKISEDDYRVLVSQYRAEAKKLLRQIDKGSEEQRRRAAELVGGYLEELGIAIQSAGPAAEPVAKAEAAPVDAKKSKLVDAKPAAKAEDEDDAGTEDEAEADEKRAEAEDERAEDERAEAGDEGADDEGADDERDEADDEARDDTREGDKKKEARDA